MLAVPGQVLLLENSRILPTVSLPSGERVAQMAGSLTLQLVPLSAAAAARRWGLQSAVLQAPQQAAAHCSWVWGLHSWRARWGLQSAVLQAPQRAAAHCSWVWGLHSWRARRGQRLVLLWGRPAGPLCRQ